MSVDYPFETAPPTSGTGTLYDLTETQKDEMYADFAEISKIMEAAYDKQVASQSKSKPKPKSKGKSKK